MSDESSRIIELRKSLKALIAGERNNQLYYLFASVVGLGVGFGLIWWSSPGHIQSVSDSAKALVNGALPMVGSALSVTRIADCESKIAQYRAALALRGPALAIAFKLLEATILARGAGHRG